MSKEIIIVVDEEDNIIGHKDRYKLSPDDIYRVSALWLTNSKGDILLAQRSFDKKHHPGKWGPAVAGTVKIGQSYDDNIIQETAEEIGLKDINLIKSFKKFNSGAYYHFTQWYTLVIDKDIKDFIIDSAEVASIKWFTKAEIRQKLKEDPDFFIPYLKDYFKLFE
ncbi:MAG: NUDIX domain-containing protein [Patescibacteria group bacterium]|jgi:isopentenyldiphosphate isomerase